MTWYRIYRRGSRAPRDWLGKVDADTAEEALRKWRAMVSPTLLAQEGRLEAVAPHPRKPGK